MLKCEYNKKNLLWWQYMYDFYNLFFWNSQNPITIRKIHIIIARFPSNNFFTMFDMLIIYVRISRVKLICAHIRRCESYSFISKIRLCTARNLQCRRHQKMCVALGPIFSIDIIARILYSNLFKLSRYCDIYIYPFVIVYYIISHFTQYIESTIVNFVH